MSDAHRLTAGPGPAMQQGLGTPASCGWHSSSAGQPQALARLPHRCPRGPSVPPPSGPETDSPLCCCHPDQAPACQPLSPGWRQCLITGLPPHRLPTERPAEMKAEHGRHPQGSHPLRIKYMVLLSASSKPSSSQRLGHLQDSSRSGSAQPTLPVS